MDPVIIIAILAAIHIATTLLATKEPSETVRFPDVFYKGETPVSITPITVKRSPAHRRANRRSGRRLADRNAR